MNEKIIPLGDTTSTNAYLKALIKDDLLPEFSVVYSGFQTAGRGQANTCWESERDKNLLFSTVLYPDFVRADEQFLLSQIISLSIRQVLMQYTERITIKWPNDIYWKDCKICGTLIENKLLGNRIESSIVGAGVNLNQEIFYSDAPNPVSLKQITGKDFDREDILRELLSAIKYFYQEAKNGKQAVIDNYKSSLYRREGFFPYMDNHSKCFKACIADVEPSGLLVLKTNRGELKKFGFKEVKFI